MEDPNAKVLIENQGDVLSVILNTPAKGNCLAPDVVDQLIDLFSTAQNVRMATIRGNGKNFCTGFDLSDIETLSDGDLLWRLVRIELLLQTIHKSPIPIVAFAQGQVVGAGADLFAACWRRVAVPEARFRMPGWNFELALGTRRLAQIVGTDKAQDILIDTRTFSATEAVNIGFATDTADIKDWATLETALAQRARALPAYAVGEMLGLSRADTDDLDLAAVVRTAARPGLKQRIFDYRETALRAAREKRRAS
ncbi:enoyl-CoA hydratase/isomerase family protein [Oceaniglobus ichthyenteri]|uniref:enoyl-CoA hydratase/isomerase family protein n=1 Tax=Oceaniglobus ichthyenteri TaxID=2136177 RepID=UPI000D3B45A3|nr:enoyl-CoA hydratase/isomerase family protein [Oceaniglobus ichthyenteri]